MTRAAHPTRRERQVLAAVLRHHGSHKQAARELGITTRTVAAHLQAVYRSLELETGDEVVCASDAALALHALDLAVIEEPLTVGSTADSGR